MPDPLLMTKVGLPILRHILVTRKKVCGQLSEGLRDGHLLTLVSAPAGYGKTTTIRMWVEEAGYPVAWVTLEKSDNDLKQFLIYAIAALQRAVDDLGQAALEVVENAQEINLQHILRLLINDLCDLDQPIILVLEDYHLIENENIDQVIELMLNQAIANLHLVITTREDPNLPLTRLRVRNQLTEIRAADLSFSLEEAGGFFSNVMGVNLSGKETEILKNRAEGWPAGLQLAALSLKEGKDTAKFVEAFHGTHRHILDYLIEEVLNNQSEEIREFLQQTSILDQLSPSLCEAVTGQEASRKYLHYLEHNNLFLVSLDEERTWYRYHALFAELLKNQLLQAEPERADDLHERAADWYEEHGFIQKAIEHAFQISNSRKASELIENHAIPMLYQGEVLMVVGWFDRLTESILQSSPMLCICKAWAFVLMQRGARRREAEQALYAANHALNRVNADDALRDLVAGHTASIQASLLRRPALIDKKPEALIALSQDAQRLLPVEEKAIRSHTALNIGYGYLALADLKAASLAFKQALEDGLSGGNFYAAIDGPINLVSSALFVGHPREALQLCDTNIERFNQILAGKYFPPIGALYILKGSLLLEFNRLSEAEQILTEGTDLVRWTGDSAAYRKGYTALARLRAIQGNRSAMLEAVKTLEETWPEGTLYAQALRHRLSIRNRPDDPDVQKDAYAWLVQSEIEFDELAAIDSVDPINDAKFECYLGAAHVLARLAQGKPGAYPLEDVHAYLERQQDFAETHGIVSWVVAVAIARTLLYQAGGKKEEALETLEVALSAAAPSGLLRIFVDESEPLQALLEEVKPRLTDDAVIVYANRLLEAFSGTAAKPETGEKHEVLLSERELEVLQNLAKGLSYEEIGRQLFLSLNTVQSHVKNIYRKLLVNKRVQAIEKAREMNLI